MLFYAAANIIRANLTDSRPWRDGEPPLRINDCERMPLWVCHDILLDAGVDNDVIGKVMDGLGCLTLEGLFTRKIEKTLIAIVADRCAFSGKPTAFRDHNNVWWDIIACNNLCDYVVRNQNDQSIGLLHFFPTCSLTGTITPLHSQLTKEDESRFTSLFGCMGLEYALSKEYLPIITTTLLDTADVKNPRVAMFIPQLHVNIPFGKFVPPPHADIPLGKLLQIIFPLGKFLTIN